MPLGMPAFAELHRNPPLTIFDDVNCAPAIRRQVRRTVPRSLPPSTHIVQNGAGPSGSKVLLPFRFSKTHKMQKPCTSPGWLHASTHWP